jgi:hypothetical protein
MTIYCASNSREVHMKLRGSLLTLVAAATAAPVYMAWTRRPGEYVYPDDCDPSYGE